MDGGGIATGLTSNALTDRLQRTSGSAPLAQRGSRRDPLTIQIHTYMLDGAVLFTSFETEWGGVREDGNI